MKTPKPTAETRAASLGRDMTEAERKAVDRARGVAKVRKAAEKKRADAEASASPNPYHHKTNPDSILPSGRTPRQEVDYWRAMQIRSKIMREAGELVYRSDVAEAVSRQWEVVGNDLRYSLPGEVADRLTGRVPAAAIRKAVREAVEAMVDAWKKGGGLYGPKK